MNTPVLENRALNIMDVSDYNIYKKILSCNDEESSKIKEYFIKSGIYYIRNFQSFDKQNYYNLLTDDIDDDDMLLSLSMKWAYKDLVQQLSSKPDSLEKAYYYSLIYKTSDNKCMHLLSEVKLSINKKDFKFLSLKDKYEIAILEFNLISMRQLNYEIDNKNQRDKLNMLLESVSIQSKSFEYIKNICNDNGKNLNKLNNMLIKHEEYYMKKSTMTKWGGTIYGDLLKIQAIVYDYYFFYKKNYLMLDWFNDVSKMCEPYIKAILSTYYPDEYQYSRTNLERTHVEQYPLNLIDIDMIVRHVKLSDFELWVSHYKVFQLNLIEDLDITIIFDNFCRSIRNYWRIEYLGYIDTFSKLLSLLVLSDDECHNILNSYIKLVIPDNIVKIKMLRNCLRALWLFIYKHYDSDEELYYTLLDLLIDEYLLTEPLDMQNDYINLIRSLSSHSDEKIYKKCCNLIYDSDSERKKAYYPYIFVDILLKFDKEKWVKWIKNNISRNWNEELLFYLEKKIIIFDEIISKEIELRLENMKYTKGVLISPDHKAELINKMVILILLGIISDLNKVDYLKKYCDESVYLDFIFNPDTFDYSKVNTADIMWCNFINSKNYRKIILTHKSDFWSEKEEKRIELGFGGNFEKRVVYKYLFD